MSEAWWWLIIIFVIAPMLGFMTGYVYRLSKKEGTIHVHQSEEKDTYLFEFNIPPEKIPTMKSVTFKVSIEEDHSQNIQSS